MWGRGERVIERMSKTKESLALLSIIGLCAAISVLAQPTPTTPFVIYGYVFYEDGSECKNPMINITNLNSGAEWQAETNECSNYYQLVLVNETGVNASEMLQFEVKNHDESQLNITSHKVTLEEINNGGIFNFNITLEAPEAPTALTFDTGKPANPYPSISGTHNGTITPYVTIYNVSKLYTYPCPGTGGHTEYVAFYHDPNRTEKITEGHWNGYASDWHNVSFSPFTMLANHTYYYTIKTGSYPQIHHAPVVEAKGGMGIINCTSFVDANGRSYTNWIPAIRLVGEIEILDLIVSVTTDKQEYCTGEPVNVKISLTNNGLDTGLSFPSSQLADFNVTNEAGEQIYLWSHGKRFLLYIRGVSIKQGESLELLNDTWNQTDNDGNPVPPGKYYINGWMVQGYGWGRVPSHPEMHGKRINITIAEPSMILLKAISFDTCMGEPSLPENLYISEYPAGIKGCYIVQFVAPVKNEWKEQLKQVGCKIYGYIPENAFTVRMTSEDTEIVQNMSFVHWLGIYQPFYKINPGLLDAEGEVNITVVSFRTESRFIPELESLGASIISTYSFGYYDINNLVIDASKIDDIASMYDAYWIEPFSVPEPFDEISSAIVDVDNDRRADR